MNNDQIEKGLRSIQASLRSSGVKINESYLEMMREKLRGDISTDEFFQRVRESMKGKV